MSKNTKLLQTSYVHGPLFKICLKFCTVRFSQVTHAPRTTQRTTPPHTYPTTAWRQPTPGPTPYGVTSLSGLLAYKYKLLEHPYDIYDSVKELPPYYAIAPFLAAHKNRGVVKAGSPPPAPADTHAVMVSGPSKSLVVMKKDSNASVHSPSFAFGSNVLDHPLLRQSMADGDHEAMAKLMMEGLRETFAASAAAAAGPRGWSLP